MRRLNHQHAVIIRKLVVLPGRARHNRVVDGHGYSSALGKTKLTEKLRKKTTLGHFARLAIKKNFHGKTFFE